MAVQIIHRGLFMHNVDNRRNVVVPALHALMVPDDLNDDVVNGVNSGIGLTSEKYTKIATQVSNANTQRLHMIRQLIAANPSVLTERFCGDLPIEWAVRHGDSQMVTLLLPFYPDLAALSIQDPLTGEKTSLLCYALEMLRQSGFRTIAQDIIAKANSLEALLVPDSSFKENCPDLPVIRQLRVGKVAVLINNNGKLNKISGNQLPIELALKHGDTDMFLASLPYYREERARYQELSIRGQKTWPAMALENGYNGIYNAMQRDENTFGFGYLAYDLRKMNFRVKSASCQGIVDQIQRNKRYTAPISVALHKGEYKCAWRWYQEDNYNKWTVTNAVNFVTSKSFVDRAKIDLNNLLNNNVGHALQLCGKVAAMQVPLCAAVIFSNAYDNYLGHLGSTALDVYGLMATHGILMLSACLLNADLKADFSKQSVATVALYMSALLTSSVFPSYVDTVRSLVV